MDMLKKYEHSVIPNRQHEYPALMTEQELVQFLRIPEISKAKNHSYVIDKLKRMRDLPCIHICRQPLYPLKSVLEWLDQQVEKEKSR